MKKIILFTLIMAITIPTMANETFTITPPGSDAWEFSHGNYYIWKISDIIPIGEQIDYFEISFSEIYNVDALEKNILFAQMLGPQEISGIDFDSEGVYVGSDNAVLHENDIAQYGGVELFSYVDSDGPLTTDNLVYTFNEEQLSLLNSYIQPDGTLEFALAFDPDCWYRFRHWWGWWRCSQPQPPPVVVPAPGAILLGGIGVVLVGWLRRRRTL